MVISIALRYGVYYSCLFSYPSRVERFGACVLSPISTLQLRLFERLRDLRDSIALLLLLRYALAWVLADHIPCWLSVRSHYGYRSV